MRNRLVFGAMVMAVLSLAASPAWADGWSGVAQDFEYFNGGDLHGKFGEPIADGNKLVFFDVILQANSQNGALVTDGDTVSFDVQCLGTARLSRVHVWAFGSYTMTGAGSQVIADLELTVTELAGLGRSWVDLDEGYDPVMPITCPEYTTGGWYGIAELDLSAVGQDPAELLHIDMGSLLTALSAAGGGAEINTQGQDLGFEFFFVPEPGTLALLGLGLFTLIRRRVF